MFATGSICFVFCYMLFHTRSVFLSAMSLPLMFASIPLAFCCYAGVADSNKVTVASLLSLFLIVGLGSDVVFVFTEFWGQSAGLKMGVKPEERIAWTVKHAGMACLATTFTTACSFLANLASVLKPLREFGVFMGLCVIFVYVLVLVLYPPLLLLNRKLVRCFRCYDHSYPYL